jgi:MraZ protein
MDSHGRILIPPVLREWAGLTKPVRMIGQVKKFELWDEENWLSHTEALDAPLSDELISQSNVLKELVL